MTRLWHIIRWPFYAVLGLWDLIVDVLGHKGPIE